MSEEGTPQVQPEAPVVPQEPAQPGSPPAPKPGEGNIHDVRRGLTEKLRVQENINPETGKHDLKDESGKFVAGTPPVETDRTPPEGETPPEGGEPGVGAEGASPPATPQMVEVEIPEHHWLRKDRGHEKFPPVPAEFEDLLKGVLADPVRRSEVQKATERAQDLTAQLEEAAAVAEFWQERASFFASNPDIALRVEQIKENMGEAEAARYINGLMQEDSETLSQKVMETRQRIQQQSANRDAAIFVNYAQQDLGNLYPNTSPEQISRVIQMYGQAVQAGQVSKVHRDTMREFAGSVLGRPGGTTPVSEQTKEEVYTKEQVQELVRKAQEEAANKVASNPLGSFSSGSAAAPSNPSATPPQQQSEGVPNVRDVRRNLRFGASRG